MSSPNWPSGRTHYNDYAYRKAGQGRAARRARWRLSLRRVASI
ncbi:hypothetical protein [Rosistilla oblonga]